MTLGIGVQAKARFRKRTFFANAGHHILKHFPRGLVIEDIISGNSGDGERPRKTSDLANPLLVVATAGMCHGKVKVSAKQTGAALDVRSCLLRKNLWERKNEVLAFRMAGNIGEFEKTFSLVCPAAAQRQQLGELSVCFAISWIAKNTFSIGEIETAPYKETRVKFFRFFQRGMGQHNAGKRIAISEGNRMMAVFVGCVYQLLGM